MAKSPTRSWKQRNTRVATQSWNVGWWHTVSETRKLIAVIIGCSTQSPTNVIAEKKSRGKEATELRAELTEKITQRKSRLLSIISWSGKFGIAAGQKTRGVRMAAIASSSSSSSSPSLWSQHHWRRYFSEGLLPAFSTEVRVLPLAWIPDRRSARHCRERNDTDMADVIAIHNCGIHNAALATFSLGLTKKSVCTLSSIIYLSLSRIRNACKKTEATAISRLTHNV